MSDKDLKSFKIGDNHRAGISSPVSSKDSAANATSPSQSVGFARIEKILEDETPETVSQKLQTLVTDIENFEQNADNNKDKLAANKALGAIERVADLMDYLFQTKASMHDNAS